MRLPAALLLLVLAVACEGDEPRTTATPPAPSISAPKITVLDEELVESGSFEAGGGHLRCSFDIRQATCQGDVDMWTEQARGSCQAGLTRRPEVRFQDYDNSTTVRAACGEDAPQRAAVLRDGEGLQLGPVRCVARNSSVDCVHTGLGLGFTATLTAVTLTGAADLLALAVLPPPLGQDVVAPAGSHATFQSPTGNISCELTSDRVECAVAQTAWKPPPGQSPRCEVTDPGPAARLEGSEPGQAVTSCAWQGDASVLSYGRALEIGNLRCLSARTGVTCRNARTKHGFEVSRTRFRGF